MSTRFKLTISYDGRDYVGWQSQRNGVSIQDTLGTAFENISGTFIRPQGSGRTDAGVHAVAQVAHVDLSWAHSVEALQRALNSALPNDIYVSEVVEAEHGFHAQHSARKKWYRYVVYESGREAPPPIFSRGYVWDCSCALKLTTMREVARQLVGTHDYASFQGSGASVKTTVRTLNKITINRGLDLKWPYSLAAPALFDEANNGQYLVFDFVGNGFLKQMVRNLMGLLIEVGQGKRTVAEVKQVLQACDRKKAGLCAPPYGLYLMKVDY